MRRSAALLAALLALVLVAAGCGSKDQTATTRDSTTTSTTPTTGEPTATDPVAISIRTAGGFVPFGADFTGVPLLVLTDGTALTGGAVPAIYPGPAISPVMTGALGAGTLHDLLDEARRAGLERDDLDAGRPGITDVGTTTITVVLDGRRHHTDAYALYESAEHDPSLTASQRSVRAALRALVEHVQDAATKAATTPYAPPAYQVLATAHADDQSQEPAPNELAWPFPELPLREHACVDIDAAHAPTFADALHHATQITVWRDAAGARWNLSTRAVLPGDGPCSSTAR